MAEKLQIDIGVVGVQQVDRALAGVERRFAQAAARMSGAAKKAQSKSALPGSSRREVSNALRGFEQIGKAARAMDLKLHRERLRAIEKEKNARIRAEQKAAMVAIKEAKKAAAAQARARRQILGRVGSSAGRAVGGIVRTGGMAIGLAGGFAASQAVGEEVRTRGQAAALANQAFGNPGETRSREQIQRDVLGLAGRESVASGRSRDEILSMLKTGVAKTGDLQTMEKLTPFLTKFADATGSDPEALGNVAGMLMDQAMQSGLKGDDVFAHIQDSMLALADQGKKGSIEMEDLARGIGAITSSAGQFEGNLSDLNREMGALAQIAISGAAMSPEEAFTAINRIPSDLTKASKQKTLQGIGVDVFTDKSRTKVKNPLEIIGDILEKTGGDLTKVGSVFNERSIKAIKPLQKAFVDAEKRQKGSGREAIMALLESKGLSGKGFTLKDLEEGAAFTRKGEGREFQRAMEDLKQTMGKELLPVLVNDLLPAFKDLAPHIKTAVEAFASFVSWFAKNPELGIAAVITGAVAKDLAGMALGSLVERLIERSVKGSTAGAGVPGGGKLGVGGTVATIGAVAGTALAVDQAGKLAKETGVDTNLTDLLPGFKNGSFDSDTLLGDIMNPFAAADRRGKVVADTVSGVANFDQNLDIEARQQARDREMKAAAEAVKANEELAAATKQGEAAVQAFADKLKNATIIAPTNKRDGTPI